MYTNPTEIPTPPEGVTWEPDPCDIGTGIKCRGSLSCGCVIDGYAARPLRAGAAWGNVYRWTWTTAPGCTEHGEPQDPMIKTATGQTWRAVVHALQHVAVPEEAVPDVAAAIAAQGLAPKDVLLVATHSIGTRRHDAEPGLPTVQDPYFPGDGWQIIRERDVSSLYAESASSGSSVSAERWIDGTWRITLSAPTLVDGSPYRGEYWRCWHEATA